MPKLVFEDAEIETNWNGTKFSVKCGAFERKDLSSQDLVKLMYPWLKQLAAGKFVTGSDGRIYGIGDPNIPG